jgi:hypothetical protein
MLAYLQKQKYQNYIRPLNRNPKNQDIFWVLGINNCQPRTLHAATLSFKNQWRNKEFLRESSLRSSS